MNFQNILYYVLHAKHTYIIQIIKIRLTYSTFFLFRIRTDTLSGCFRQRTTRRENRIAGSENTGKCYFIFSSKANKTTEKIFVEGKTVYGKMEISDLTTSKFSAQVLKNPSGVGGGTETFCISTHIGISVHEYIIYMLYCVLYRDGDVSIAVDTQFLNVELYSVASKQ